MRKCSGKPIEAPESALLKGGRRARSRLHVLKDRWQYGRLEGARVFLGAVLDPRCLYWVSLEAWEEPRLRGVIASEPVNARGRLAGSKVWLRESEIADWVVIHGNGEREGGFLWRELQRRQERSVALVPLVAVPALPS